MQTTERARLYDKMDRLVDYVEMPRRQPEQPPRKIIYKGKTYVEGSDGMDSFYGPGEFAEVENG